MAIHNGYGAFYLKQEVEGLIEAFKHPKVDVVNASLGELPSLNDGNSVMSIVVNRLVERFGKPVFVSAGNSRPGLKLPSCGTLVGQPGRRRGRVHPS